MKFRMNLTKRLLSIVLSLAMVFAMIPSTSITVRAAEASIPTIEGKRIYANGTPITIEASEGGTAVWYMNGGEKKYVNPSGSTGEDMSDWIIFGGMNTKTLNGSTSITMNGGKVKEIIGGGYNVSGTVVGNCHVIMNGGSVVKDLSGGGAIGAEVSGDVYVKMTGGTVDRIYASKDDVNGNAYVEVTGGHITNMIFTVEYSSSKITGSSSLILTNEATVSNDYLNVIRKSEADWEVIGNPEIPAGTSLVIAEGETLTLDRGESINNAGTIVNNGTVIVKSLNALLGNAVEGSGKIVYSLPYIMSNNITDVDGMEVFLNGAKQENATFKTIDGKTYFDVSDGKVLIRVDQFLYYAKYSGEEVELQPYTPISDIVVTPENINACEETVLTTTYTAGSEAQTISYEIVDAGDTEASINGNKLTAKYSGTVRVAVALTDGYTSHQENVDIAVQQIVPNGIGGEVDTKMYAQSFMTLPSNAVPDNATYKTLIWEIVDPGTTNAIIENGKLVVSNPGTVSIQGKVANGLGYGKDYVTDTYEVVVEKVENGIYISHKWNGNALTTEMKAVPDDAKILTSETVEWVDGAWYFLVNDTIIPERIIVNGTVNLVLPDGVTLTAGKGISVNEGNTLNIYAQTQNKGILNVPEDNLEYGNAGIGGDKYKNGGTIQIHGGVINIDGAAEGAGIGGGFEGHSGIITIYDGDLSITGGFRSAGIGGGDAGSGNTVYIYGGKVKASGSGEAAGIGGGSSGSGGKVYIYGGTIEANGSGYNNGAGAGIGGGGGWSVSGTGADVIIKGGNVKATGGYYSDWSTYQAPEIGGGVGKSQNKSDTGTLTSDGEEKISLKTITLAGAEENTWITEINGLDYSVHDVRTLDVNKLYFYLPGDEIPTSTKAGEVEYFCIDENTLTYYSSHDWSNADGTCTRCCEICDHAGQSGTCGICGKNLHIHSWEYTVSVDGTRIVATCVADECALTNGIGGSVTISQPKDTTYTGSEINAELTYSDDWQLGELTITYNDTDRVNVTDNDIEAAITLGSETASITYQITEASIENAEVSADNQVYTGSALTPNVSLTLNGKILSKETDYTVSYENNTNAGTATVTVTGTGNYTGTATGTFTITDETDPAGEIKIKDNSWKTFLNEILFGLFFKDTVDVTITADGTGSDVAKVEYLLSDSVLDARSLPTEGWTELEERNEVYSFSITSQNKGSVYAKITDTAGNDTVINSNGVVVYTDSKTKESTVYHTYKSTENLAIEVELNGNTVKDLAFNGHEITNYWSVDGNKVTIDGDYLGTLNVLDAGSSYPITIYFNPMGEETDKVTLETTVNLVITQTEGSVTDISNISKTYDGTVVSDPAYASLSSGTATYEYKVQGADDSTYTTKAPDTVGEYVVRVTVAEDRWYKEASATAEFSISEADLTDVSVVQNGTLTYTSEAQDVKVTIKAIALGGQNVTFTYSTEENGTYGTMPKFTKAGDYTAYYKASAPNHKDAYGSFTVTINKAVVTEPIIASKAYTRERQTADISVTDLYTVEANVGGTATGEYDVVLKLADDENYKWKSTDDAEVTLKFVITEAENSWKTEPSITGWTYGETANAPSGAAAFGTVKVVYTGAANDGTAYDSETAPVKAGNYTATFTVEATANYSGLKKTADFTIKKAAYDMSDAKWDYTNAFTYDGLEKKVFVTGLPEGVTVSNYTGEKATAAGTYTAKATLEYDGDNYNVPTVDDLTWKIENNWTPVEYTVSVPNVNGWLKEDFVITAAAGYQISLTNTADGAWSDTLTGAVEGAENSITFYLKNEATGAISLAATESYKLDKNTESTGTTGKVFFDERNGWETFLNTITFNLFFKEEVTVKAEAEDALSGVDSIEYMESSTAMSLDALKNARSVWTEMPEDGVAVTLEDAKQFIYYVRITDKAGNVTYLSTDGAEYDTTAPAISGIVNGDTYYTTQNVTVSDKNLDTVTLNGETAGANITLEGNKEATYTIVATDKAGNETTFTVTMKPVDAADEAISDITKDNVDSSDKDAIQDVIDKIDELLEDEDLTEEEKTALEDVKDTAEELLDKIEEVAGEIADITDKVDDYKKENVTSDDKPAIEDLVDRMNDLLDGENLTDAERETLEVMKDTAEDLLDQIADADKADETENIEKVKDITSENVTPDDKSDLEDAKSDLEKALEDYSSNYTEEEKKAIEDEIDRIDDALDVIDRVENVEDLIDKIPDKITKDREDEIKAAEDAYNALTDYEKTLVDKDAKKALEDAKEDLAELKKAEEESDKTTSPDTGDYANILGNIIVMMTSAMAIVLIAISKKRKVRR